MNFKNLMESFNKLISKKNVYNIIVVLLIGVLILVVSNFFKSTAATVQPASAPGQVEVQTNISTDNSLSKYENDKRTELTNLLGKMKGVGQVIVMINFESGEEKVPAINKNTGKTVTDQSDSEGGKSHTTQDNDSTNIVTASNGNETEPYILETKTPKVSGVVVVAKGAENRDVKADITAAVSSVFAIPNYQIKVFPMQ